MRMLASPFSPSQPLNERSRLPLTSGGMPRPLRRRKPALLTTGHIGIAAQFLIPPAPLKALAEKNRSPRYWLLSTVPTGRRRSGHPHRR